MSGETHIAIGVASALILMQPQSLPEMVAGMGIAAIGAVISDLDSKKSKVKNKSNKVKLLMAAIILLMLAVERIFLIEVFTTVTSAITWTSRTLAIIMFIGLCIYGEMQPHRSFMHSIIAGILLGGCVGEIVSGYGRYFYIAFVSHLVLDILNDKRVRVLYPLEKGISLGICKANKMTDKILFCVGFLIIFAFTSITAINYF